MRKPRHAQSFRSPAGTPRMTRSRWICRRDPNAGPAGRDDTMTLKARCQSFSPSPYFTSASRAIPTRTGEGIESYLKDIRGLTLLDAEEEVKIARKAARGHEESRKRMIEANLRLVVRLALRFANRGVSLCDIIEEGNLGLIHAVEKFDPERGCRFSTYAAWWIRQSMERALVRQGRAVRLPIRIHDSIRKVERAGEELMKDLERPATNEELCRYTGLTESRLMKIKNASKAPESLDCASDFEDSRPLIEKIPIQNVADPGVRIWQKKIRTIVENNLGKLSTRQQMVVKLRFGLHGEEPKTLREISKSCGVSRERIRQIETAALKKLRQTLEKEGVRAADI